MTECKVATRSTHGRDLEQSEDGSEIQLVPAEQRQFNSLQSLDIEGKGGWTLLNLSVQRSVPSLQSAFRCLDLRFVGYRSFQTYPARSRSRSNWLEFIRFPSTDVGWNSFAFVLIGS